jgi:hypothetical protein
MFEMKKIIAVALLIAAASGTAALTTTAAAGAATLPQATAPGDRDLAVPAGNDEPLTREGAVGPDGTRIGGFSVTGAQMTGATPDGTRIGGF